MTDQKTHKGNMDKNSCDSPIRKPALGDYEWVMAFWLSSLEVRITKNRDSYSGDPDIWLMPSKIQADGNKSACTLCLTSNSKFIDSVSQDQSAP